MKRTYLVFILGVTLLLSLACLTSPGVVPPIATPARFETTGNRTSFSGEYSCTATNSVNLFVGDDGLATLSSTGPVFVDYINCTVDPSGFEDTYTIIGVSNIDTHEVTFSSCNEGGFTAKGTISFADGKLAGSVSCIYTTGDEAGKTRMTLTVPSILSP